LAGSLLRLGAVLPLAIYAVASLLTFVLYWRDKHSALKDRWRTPETTLHFFELAGRVRSWRSRSFATRPAS